ncbi:MAG: HlyC/CorC family transporter [Phycisphaeraceae bacterium]|nr:HlyC/CorC family transporter [Phycisphaeraceae bacterium]
MLDLPLILMILALPLLLLASAFFSGCETALFGLSRHQRRALIQKPGNNLVGHAIQTLLDETRALLITLLLGNMIVNVLFFVISTVMLIRLKEHHQVSTAIITVAGLAPLLLLILCGEVLPKLIAAQHGEGWARLGAIPLLVIHRVLAVARVPMGMLIVTPLARLIAPHRMPDTLSAEELESLLEISQQRGVIDPAEENLLQQVLSLNQLRVRDIMTPRVDMHAHMLDDGPASLLELIRATGLTRVPVCRRDLDDVVGMVYARQVLLREPATPEQLAKLVRQVRFVPEIMRADKLLIHFRKQGSTFAIAVDEYGGTAGLVTLEDVVEAMVGPIAGSHEQNDTPMVAPLPDHSWRIRADLPLQELANVFGPVGETHGLATLGGLVMAQLARLPKPGDHVTIANLAIEVESMAGHRIQSLILRLAGPEHAHKPQGESSSLGDSGDSGDTGVKP